MTTAILNTRVVTIDDTTGLPVLPEDLFWRIEEAKIKCNQHYRPTKYGYGFSYVDEYKSTGTVEINLIRKTEKHVEAVEEVLDAPHTVFKFGIPIRKRNVLIPYQPAKDVTEEKSIRWGSLLETRDNPVDKDDYDDRDWNHDNLSGGAWKATPPSKENITNLATKIWNEYIDQQHGLARTEDGERELGKFLGDFPPKNLHKVA